MAIGNNYNNNNNVCIIYIIPINLFLHSKCSTENDWHEVENLIGFSTSEEPPNVAELETFLKCPPKSQTLVKLLTINQMTVGVYIVRLRGIKKYVTFY